MATNDILLGATRTSSNLTISLATGPLASDANLLAGRNSTLVDNTTNKFPDYIFAGFITTGTSPTVGTTIEVWAYGTHDDAYTLPDGITSSDANKTLTSINTKNSGLVLLHVITVTATTAVKYDISPRSLRAAFGGVLPKKFGIFVVHNTGVALNSSAGNHQLTITPDFMNLSS